MREGWEIKTLGNLTEVITKGTTPTSVGFKFEEGGVNFVKVESITPNGKFIPKKFAHISEVANNALKRSQLKEGDILFSIAGALGRTAIVNKEILPANTNQALSIIRLKEDSSILKKYVLSVLTSGYALEQVEKFKGGVAQQNLSLTQMKAFQIPIPPLQEQQQIVNILDEAFEAIDQAIANIEKNIANAQELFQSKLNEIFSQRGEGWEEKKLKDLCLSTSNIKWQEYKNESFEYIDLSSVSRDTLTVTETSTINNENAPSRAKQIVLANDVIFATTRPTLKRVTLITEEYHNQICSTGYAVLRANQEVINPNWIYYFIQTDLFMKRMEKLQRGASYPAVSGKDVMTTKMRYPKDFAVQKVLLALLDGLSSSIQEVEMQYSEKLDSLKDLKKSILQKAFAGELTNKEVESLQLAAEPEEHY